MPADAQKVTQTADRTSERIGSAIRSSTLAVLLALWASGVLHFDAWWFALLFVVLC